MTSDRVADGTVTFLLTDIDAGEQKLAPGDLVMIVGCYGMAMIALAHLGLPESASVLLGGRGTRGAAMDHAELVALMRAEVQAVPADD